MSKDYYNVLGIQKGASQEEIKKAYRRLAHQHHPDKGDSGNEEKFKEVNEAYQVLGDPKKRQQYDSFGQTFGGGAQGPGPGFGGFGQGAEGINFDLGDIFGEFFGGRESAATQKNGRDIQIKVEVALTDAILGTRKKIKFDTQIVCEKCKGKQYEPGSKMKTCSTCGGVGKVQQNMQTAFGTFASKRLCPSCHGAGEEPEKKCKECYGEGRARGVKEVDVDIPANTISGDTIKIAGEGEAGRGGKHGDLYVQVYIKRPKRLSKKAKKLLEDLKKEGI